MLFTVCQNSIEKYDFRSVALYAPLPEVLQVAKSPVLLAINKPRHFAKIEFILLTSMVSYSYLFYMVCIALCPLLLTQLTQMKISNQLNVN